MRSIKSHALPAAPKRRNMSHDVSELFSRQKLFHAHKQMQYELSSNARVQADYDQKELADIRAQFRTVDPLYRAMVDDTAWPSDDEIGMGRSPELARYVRARVPLEVPAMEAAGVLAQPSLLVPCVFPGARVFVQQHDAFSGELEVVQFLMPSFDLCKAGIGMQSNLKI